MITGLNSDVRYRGVAFHVQTEDSGRAHPHVISHLYLGGSILASEKTDYGDDLDLEDLDERVRSIVESQHRGMLEGLAAGGFDTLIEARQEETPGDRNPTPTISDGPALPPQAALLGPLDAEPRPLDELILEHLEGGGRRRGAVPASTKARAQG